MNEVSLLYDMYCRINIELHITVHVDSSYIMLLYLRNSMTTHYKPTRFESSPILCFVRTCVWKYGEMPSAICVKISAKEYIHTCIIYIWNKDTVSSIRNCRGQNYSEISIYFIFENNYDTCTTLRTQEQLKKRYTITISATENALIISHATIIMKSSYEDIL